MKPTMPQKKIRKLLNMEKKFKVPFFLPPFKNDCNSCFFDITEIKEKPVEFRDFLMGLKEENFRHQFEHCNHRDLMVVKEY